MSCSGPKKLVSNMKRASSSSWNSEIMVRLIPALLTRAIKGRPVESIKSRILFTAVEHDSAEVTSTIKGCKFGLSTSRMLSASLFLRTPASMMKLGYFLARYSAACLPIPVLAPVIRMMPVLFT